ncbi:aspartyl protease family protein [Alicyclobacillus tolerans]|uniref:aspartyl protease family protein n=1 Tax=Alicyclobacillus tolerans TaxID=90970 RepID=UPI001F3A1F2F|nr:aspartyl protease family protein [Alicyclobacillus tolerans]MCF8567739.1 aspartyl protease family protein [Alicyclobacillus tolerans]
MRIKQLSNGLLVAPIEITYNGITHIVKDVVIDTGAVRSILHVDAVEPLDINPSPTDPISRMYGIGGDDFSFRKQMEQVVFAGVALDDMMLDFGRIEGINGLIGLDILQRGKFIIDLESLKVYR